MRISQELTRTTAIAMATDLLGVGCSTSSDDAGGSSNSPLKGASGVVSGAAKTTVPINPPVAVKEPMTLCTTVLNPIDPTSQLRTKNLLANAAYKRVPSTADPRDQRLRVGVAVVRRPQGVAIRKCVLEVALGAIAELAQAAAERSAFCMQALEHDSKKVQP